MKNSAQAADQTMRSACISRRLLLLPGPSPSSSSSVQQQHKISKANPNSLHSSSKHLDISEMLKRKLSLGTKILQLVGIQRMYRRVFKTIFEGERVLKASQCYLCMTSGPIAGLLFVSTESVAFCSDRSIKFSSTEGELLGRSYYKVSIPVGKITMAAQKESVKRQKTEKYLQIVTSDNFEFWFMGIAGLKKTFKCLQQVVLSEGCGRI